MQLVDVSVSIARMFSIGLIFKITVHAEVGNFLHEQKQFDDHTLNFILSMRSFQDFVTLFQYFSSQLAST